MGDSKLYIGYYLNRLLDKKLTVTIHAYELYCKDAYQKVEILSEIFNSCHQVITISNFNRQQLISRFKVNPDKITRMYLYPANYDAASDKRKILIIGNWVKQKGYDFI